MIKNNTLYKKIIELVVKNGVSVSQNWSRVQRRRETPGQRNSRTCTAPVDGEKNIETRIKIYRVNFLREDSQRWQQDQAVADGEHGQRRRC